ncbi:MAG: helix-turn-helix transcriptional regulator [Methanobacteriaceae archaeon]
MGNQQIKNTIDIQAQYKNSKIELEREILNKLEYVNDEILFLSKSKIRLNILSWLNKESMTMREISKISEITYSSISTNLRSLQRNGYIEKNNGTYYINNLGKLRINDIKDFNNSIKFLCSCGEFFSSHDVEKLPNICLNNIIYLKSSEFITACESNIYKAHQMFKKVLLTPLNSESSGDNENSILNDLNENKYPKNSFNEIKIILPFLSEDYYTIINEILENNIKTKVILNKTLLDLFLSKLNEDILSKSLKNNTLDIRICKKAKILFCMSNSTMSLGLFKWSGDYDQNRVLVSDNSNGLNWGNNLFNNYYEKSEKPYLKRYRV